MNKLFLYLLLLIPSWLIGQFTDNFSDGELLSNPKWQGEVNDFAVDVQGRLQLDTEPITGNKTIFTSSFSGDSTTWSFDIFMDFNTSSANYCTLFLAAEDSLISEGNALYAILGGTKDNIQIWQQTSSETTLVLESNDRIFDKDSSSTRISIKLEGNSLTIDTGFQSLQTLASAAVFLEPINTRYFALQPNFTTSRSDKFWFDNIKVEGNQEKIPPKIVLTSCLNPNEVKLHFSETMDSSSMDASNFLLNNSITPNSIEAFSKSVVLTFGSPLKQQAYHSILVSGIDDVLKNTISDTAVYLFCGSNSSATKGDIVLNEIMANPKPNAFLPEEEFIEIYNASNKAIQLSSLGLFNGATQQNFTSDTILLPNEYYTICGSSKTNLFADAGINKVLGVSNFSTLNNTTDSLTLTSNGVAIDIVTYYTNWYNSPKASGGFSLERIDPKSTCNDPFNFKYSNATDQATPSSENSVLTTELASFEILSATALPNETVEIETSSAVDVYEFQAGTIALGGVASAGMEQNTQKPNTYSIRFSTWPNDDKTASVLVQNLASCRGSILDTAFTLSIPTKSIGNELHITEMMIDPNPTVGLPEAEYIELYNSAEYSVYLSDFKLVANNKNYELPNQFLAPKAYVLLISESDSALFANQPFTALSSFPTLINSTGSIALQHIESGTSEEIQYSISHYRDSDKAKGGFSLENIRPTENCLGKLNFMPSTDPLGGTPGKINSVFIDGATTSEPRIENAAITDQNLTLVFDRNINTSPDFDLGSIAFTPTVPFAIDYIHQDSILINLFGTDSIFNYQLIVNDLEDCLGNRVDTTINISVGKEPRAGDIIFSEIMADPTPNDQIPELEYFEIFNTQTFPIQINHLNINGVELNNNYVLPPKGYLLISKEAHLFGIPNAISVPGLSASFLTNGGKKLVLENSLNGEIITQINYSDAWHTDDLAKGGGISLEITNTDALCYNSAYFWASSNNNNGGTPGNVNSVHKKSIPKAEPNLQYYHNQRLSFGFSQPLILDSLSFSFEELIDSVYLSDNQNLLHFQLLNGLPKELATYSFDIKECNTNNVVRYSGALKLPVAPSFVAVIVNEVLYDAKENQNEFIELYNPSSEYLSLYNTRFSLDSKKGILDTMGILLSPNSFLLLAADTSNFSSFIHQNALTYYPYLELPNLSNSGFEFLLSSSSNDTLDYVSVSNDLHYPLLTETKGVALERIHHPDQSVSNFISAPENRSYASPGLKNGNPYLKNDIANHFDLSDSYISANGDGYQDFIRISYSNPTLQSIDITVFDRAGFIVKRIAHNYVHAGTSSFIWIGDNEDGHLTEAGIYILVLYVSSNGKSSNRVRKTVTVSR